MAKITITLEDKTVDGIEGVDVQIHNDSPRKPGEEPSEAQRTLSLMMWAVHQGYEATDVKYDEEVGVTGDPDEE